MVDSGKGEAGMDPETQDVGALIAELKEDMKKVRKLKKENKLLKDQVNGLLQNNSKFTSLVEALDERLKEASEAVPGRFEYHFMEGGWRQKGALKKSRMELSRKKADIQDINSQLEEIIRLMKKNKK